MSERTFEKTSSNCKNKCIFGSSPRPCIQRLQETSDSLLDRIKSGATYKLGRARFAAEFILDRELPWVSDLVKILQHKISTQNFHKSHFRSTEMNLNLSNLSQTFSSLKCQRPSSIGSTRMDSMEWMILRGKSLSTTKPPLLVMTVRSWFSND